MVSIYQIPLLIPITVVEAFLLQNLPAYYLLSDVSLILGWLIINILYYLMWYFIFKFIKYLFFVFMNWRN